MYDIRKIKGLNMNSPTKKGSKEGNFITSLGKEPVR
jgi:hypothetical protein